MKNMKENLIALVGGILLGLAVCIALYSDGGIVDKVYDTYKYHQNISMLEEYIDEEYGVDCCLDTENLLVDVEDEYAISNVLDSDGNYVAGLWVTW